MNVEDIPHAERTHSQGHVFFTLGWWSFWTKNITESFFKTANGISKNVQKKIRFFSSKCRKYKCWMRLLKWEGRWTAFSSAVAEGNYFLEMPEEWHGSAQPSSKKSTKAATSNATINCEKPSFYTENLFLSGFLQSGSTSGAWWSPKEPNPTHPCLAGAAISSSLVVTSFWKATCLVLKQIESNSTL